LRGIFASLAGPTKQATDALAKYGITADQINPEKTGLIGAMEVLAKANISTADAMQIFGREAASGALVMAGTTGRMNELSEAFGNAEGAAQDMADVMSDNLNGDILSMQSAIEGLTIALGDGGATGALRVFVQTGTEAVRGITNNLGPLINTVAALASGWVAYRIAILAASVATSASTAAFFSQAGAILAASSRMGVLTSATAAATIATRTLTGALLANPFTAAAAAVGILVTAFVSLAGAQRQAKAETDNLINGLKALAEARAADFASQRAMVAGRLAVAQGTDPNSGMLSRVLPQWARNAALSDRQREIANLTRTLREADIAFAQAEKAAASIEAPADKAAKAMSGVGDASEKAEKKLKNKAVTVQDLAEKYFPEMISRAQEAELQLVRLEVAAGRLSQEFGTSLRLRIMGANPGEISDRLKKVFNDNGPGSLEDMKMRTINMKNIVDKQLTGIGDSFGTMADRALQALDRLSQGIQRGDFLSILSGILGIGLQLGGMGLFGSKVAANINSQGSLPARANGGMVSSGNSYLVGERGPEIFTPNGSGFITPNGGGGGGGQSVVVINNSALAEAFVQEQITATAPAIMQGAAQVTQQQMSRQARRRT
jgi:hypothetical protein